MSVAEPAERAPYRGYRIPPEIIAHAVWLYFRFHLSFRDIQDLLAERGVVVSRAAAVRRRPVRRGPCAPAPGGTSRSGIAPIGGWSAREWLRRIIAASS